MPDIEAYKKYFLEIGNVCTKGIDSNNRQEVTDALIKVLCIILADSKDSDVQDILNFIYKELLEEMAIYRAKIAKNTAEQTINKAKGLQ